MKLLFYIKDKTNKKVYTLKPSKVTKPAHYKFIKIRDVQKTR